MTCERGFANIVSTSAAGIGAPLNDDGSVAYIDTPFTFEDGDPLPIYFEKIFPSEVVFFDDGEIIWHFIGRGSYTLPLPSSADLRVILPQNHSN